LVIRARGGRLQTVSYLDKKCDPLTYPLLFPNGDDGWHPHLEKQTNRTRTRTRVTQKEFYSYLLFPRANIFNPLLYAGKLFQQYAVDSWLKIEMNRLKYYKQNQSQLRLDTVQGLRDYIVGDADHSGPPGRRIILGSSFAGGPRHMIAEYQDAMAIVSKYGKPDIFLTFTCNPRWEEITVNLAPNQIASDRPDIVARVFNLKVKALCHELFKRKVLGEVSAYIYVIEFQKRGLPHMHMLITLKDGWKVNTAAQVDSLICAELPCPTEDPELFDIVSKNMIHRPCGLLNPTSPCMKNGRCSKKFPKPFRTDTSLSVDGYPEYRRRDDGRFVMCRGTGMNNRFVVPYSPYLTRLFRAHINVEVCALLHVVKYVYKYVYKGSDRARVRLSRAGDEETVHDEIENYIDARYVCAPEAIHRVFGFNMQDRSVSVKRLQIHLPELQPVTFVSGAEQQALDTASGHVTTLTAYFLKNKTCSDLIQLYGQL
uniref:Helitron_like_N domain-containing protein n=2 Tax=Heligmosomoides polygyrus TaxID=6339 RepID=A0A183FBM3_HELPZ